MSVLLKKSPFEGISPKELAQQIESKKKCISKLPLWFDTPGIYYPKKANIEQCSSATTASYKAEIIGGKSLLDLSGGLGVDSYYFSRRTSEVYHLEIDRELAEIAAHNFKKLSAQSITAVNIDGIEFLKSSNQKFDWIYIDPSRRDPSQKRVYKLSDCYPDITMYLELIFSKTKNVLIKTAPLLDISAGIGALRHIREIHIVALKNDVKEILWVLQSEYSGAITLKTVNYEKNGVQHFDFDWKSERDADSKLSDPLKYLYEPNAAILKAGAFKTTGNSFSLAKLHPNTHLYTSENPIGFPGRRFEILYNLPYNKKTMKLLGLDKANITVRNFPLSVAAVRKKFNIKDGGTAYLFFVTDYNKALRVLFCTRNMSKN